MGGVEKGGGGVEGVGRNENENQERKNNMSRFKAEKLGEDPKVMRNEVPVTLEYWTVWDDYEQKANRERRKAITINVSKERAIAIEKLLNDDWTEWCRGSSVNHFQTMPYHGMNGIAKAPYSAIASIPPIHRIFIAMQRWGKPISR